MTAKIDDGLTRSQRYYLRKKTDPHWYAAKLASIRRSYAKYREKRLEYAKQYGAARRLTMTEEDRERQRKHSLNNYYKYRDLHQRRQKNKAAERLALINSRKNVPCADCSNSYPEYVMEFDHRPPYSSRKDGQIAKFYSKSWSRIEKEIAKCDVVCANCHRTRTWKRRQEKKPSS